MKTKKTESAPLATEPTAPSPDAPPAKGKVFRNLMSGEVPEVSRDDRTPTPPRRGPMTGTLSDADFCAIYGTAQEFTRWAGEIRVRQAKAPENWIWFSCRCGLVTKAEASADGSHCIKCNWGRLVDGGHLRKMDDAEVEAYLAAKAARDRAADEQLRRSAFNIENDERRKHGLGPLTMEEYKRRGLAEFRLKLQREDAIRAIGEAGRKKP